jgi:two-component system, response regulator / RNA-binding antiterminator
MLQLHNAVRSLACRLLRPWLSSAGMTARLSIIVVEKDPDRALRIVDGLREAGDHDIRVIAESTGLARHIAERQPDIVLIDAGDPSRDVLEELALASGPMERPVAMFVDRSDAPLTRAAIEAGVSAYVVDGLQADRIKPILDAAIARFHMFQKMRMELAATKAALEDRKIIDRAKAILMKARGIDEEAAYALLRKTAMDQKRKVADIAQQLVMAAGLLT